VYLVAHSIQIRVPATLQGCLLRCGAGSASAIVAALSIGGHNVMEKGEKYNSDAGR